MTRDELPSGAGPARAPWALLLAVVAAATLLGVCAWAAVDAVRNGYGVWPPSANLQAAARERVDQLGGIGALLATATLLPWAWARRRRHPAAVLAAVWGGLLVAVPWAWIGYHYNRYAIASLWRERSSVAGVAIPRALLDGRAWAHNGLTTLIAVALAWVLARALRGATSRLPSRSAGRVVSRAGVVCVLALALLRFAPATWGRPRPHGPDIILVTLDAMRADRLGCYGYPLPTSPHLDAFAGEGVRFARAYSQEPWTLTSHMSMLTGLYPDAHGLDFGRALAPQVWTIAERLRDAGYRTAGSVFDCYLLDPRFGYAAGFDHYTVDRRAAKRRCADAVRWLLSDARPAFLFLHLYDPHSDTGELPYDAPAPFRDQFARGRAEQFARWTAEGGASETLRKVNEGQTAMPDSLRDALSRLYDAGAAATDAAFGQLLDGLRQAGRLDDAVVIVLADHGEALGEQGQFMHERMMEATLHIPLIVHWPRGDHAGLVRDDLVETVDVAPTVLAAAGLAAEPICQGHDLRTPVQPPRLAAFSRSGLDYALTTQDGWRLLYTWDGRGPHFTALHHLTGDPGDGPDLLPQLPERVDPWVDWIWTRHRANELLAAKFRGGRVQMSGQDEQLLRSLGYIQ